MHSHTTELLPCPFCGDAADCAKTLNFPPDDWQWYVRCYCDVAPASWNESREKAIAAWNRRSYATALGQQGEPNQAARDVLAERARQISAEGWTPEHDDHHSDGTMAIAAACYALGNDGVSGRREFVSFWPWDRKWWKPKKDRRRNLVRAGALILAEIERLDRAALSTSEGKTE